MATSTLIQKLDLAADGFGSSTSNRRQVETFIAKETLAIGDWVAFDYAATSAGDVTLGVFKADSNSTPVRTPFGVVLRSVAPGGTLTAGSQVEVVVSGVVNAFVSDNAGAGLAIGTLLQITTTAGLADLASPGVTQPVCGILAETIAPAAGNTQKRVVVIKQF